MTHIRIFSQRPLPQSLLRPEPQNEVECHLWVSRAAPNPSGIGALTTAHKTHTESDLPVLSDLSGHRGISKLLKTRRGEGFNSVPGHHDSIQYPCRFPSSSKANSRMGRAT